MSTIIPDSQKLKNATRWISEQLRENPDAPKNELIDTAAFRFDLNPNENQYLVKLYNSNEHQSTKSS